MRRWYVVNTHARAEQKAAWHLGNQGFRLFLPQYLRQRRHARRVDMVKAPLFPRYLFVEIDLESDRWLSVTSTIGVSHLVGGANGPLSVPEGVVEEWRAREDESGLIPLAREARYRRGDRVQVNDGAFVDMVGVFDCASDEDRVFLLLDMLGRQVRVRLPVEAVAAYA